MLECLEIIFNLQKRKEKSKNMDFKTEVLLSPELHVTSNTENDEPILQYFQFVRDEETPVIEDNNVVFIKYENLLGINDDKLMEESDLNMPSTENTQLESPLLNISNLEPITLLDGSTAYLAMNSEDQYSQLKLSNGDYAFVQFQVVQSLPSPLTQDDSVSIEDLIPVEEIVKSKKRAHRCLYDGCGKLYATVHHLKVHERIHTGARPYKCEYQNCNKAFATTYSLKTHFRIHTGEKPYKCTTCEKQFKTSGDLQKHIRIHTGERPFACPYEGCNQSFTTSNIRKVHLRTHTGERPYKCNVLECGKTFVSATNYKNHMRIHSGEKPYFCKEVGCTKRFTEYSSLYKHQIVHQAQKQKVCTMCGKLYRQTSTLLQHMKISHGTYDLNEFTQNIQVDDNHLPTSSSSNSADSLSDNIFNSDETNVLGDENDGDGCLETPDNDEVLITDMEGNPVILRKYLKV